MPGTFMRAMAIMPPGMFLSQPPTTSTPSIAWPLTLVSIASAITSRETSEYFIASVPMPMPSVTVGTPNTCGLAPAASSELIARSMSGWMPALHGFMVEWPFATPTMGLSKSLSPKPTARSMARFGERATPSVISFERRLAAMEHPRLDERARFSSREEGEIQCRRGPAVILYRYESAGIVAAAVFRGGRRAAAFRPRGRGAAHLAAAALARHPRAGRAPRRRPARAQPQAGGAHPRGRPLPRGGAPPDRPARKSRARAARHGLGRAGEAAHRLRVARRLWRAARAAEALQGRAPWRGARVARDALARAGRRACLGRARLRAASAARHRRGCA